NLGVSHTVSLNSKSFVRMSLNYSGTGATDDIFETDTIRIYNTENFLSTDSISPRIQMVKSSIAKSTIRGAVTYNNKINAGNRILLGTKYALYSCNFNQNMYNYEEASLINITDFKVNLGTVNNFISWKHSVNEKIDIVAGLHNMNILTINRSTIEPRL